MTEFVWKYFIVFGCVSILLGYLGYAHAKSVASLIAGGICGLALIAGGVIGGIYHGTVGFSIATLVSLLLLGRFFPAWKKRRELYPAGLMTLLSLLGLGFGAVSIFFSLSH